MVFCFGGVSVGVDRYIFPPRASAVTPFEFGGVLSGAVCTLAGSGWWGQPKFNDSRLLVKFLPGWEGDCGLIEFWNRHGERFRDYVTPRFLLEEVREAGIALGLGGFCLLDGGLLDRKHRLVKDSVVLWDVLVLDGKWLVGSTYAERFEFLKASLPKEERPFLMRGFRVGSCWSERVFLTDCFGAGEWAGLWEGVLGVNEGLEQPLLEGIVFKNPRGVLTRSFGEKNNGEWMVRSRVRTGRHVC